MKTFLCVFLLTTLALGAQGPPTPVGTNRPAAPGAPAIVPPSVTGATNRDERREALRRMIQARTNVPGVTVPATNTALSGTGPGVLPTTPTPPGTAGPSSAASAAAAPPSTAAQTAPAAAAGVATNVVGGADTIAIAPPPGTTNRPPEQMVPTGVINFPAVDINQILKIYAELVNRTVLRPTTLPAPTITLVAQTPLTQREAVQAFDAVLALNGISMINVGEKFVKAVPMAQANQEGAAFNKLQAEQLPEMGQYVTHIVQLKYNKPSELVQVLQPFAKIPNSIQPVDTSQILVLRDYTENVKRMLELIEQIDVAVPSEYISEVIPIKYAKATEIANALNSLSSGGSGTTVGASTGGTTRTTPTSRFGTGSYGTGSTYGRPGTTYPGASGFPGATPFGTTQPAAGTTGSSFTDRLQNIIKKASVSGEITVLGQTKMIADERTNSLLIFASREDMKMIKEVVAKLDVVLAQVLIEGVIIEVALRDSSDVGFSYLQRPQSSGNFTGVGAINNTKGFNNILDFISAGTNNALSGGFSYLGRFGDDFDILVRAVAEDSRARILQRPRIQTSHNEPATLFVGESRPYPSGSYYGGGAYGGYSSINQLPIGVTLTVTPLINPDGLVVMEISQDIQSVSGEVTIANVGQVPVTSQKSAAAKVSVRDRDTIILGGLIESSRSKSASGVPILKDIPGLGYLFRSTSKKEQRTELIVLIRPTVLPTPEVAALTATAEKNRMPLVKAAEADVMREEAKRLEQADRFDERVRSKANEEP